MSISQKSKIKVENMNSKNNFIKNKNTFENIGYYTLIVDCRMFESNKKKLL